MAIRLNVSLVPPPPPPWESQVERRNHRWAAQRDRVCDARQVVTPPGLESDRIVGILRARLVPPMAVANGELAGKSTDLKPTRITSSPKSPVAKLTSIP